MSNTVFYQNDIVKVANPNLKTHNKVGVVLRVFGDSVEIQLKGLPKLTYFCGNLKLVRRELDSRDAQYCKCDIEQTKKLYYEIKENNEMVVKGNYRVAVVNFISGSNTDKKYNFALFDEEVFAGDFVLVDTAYGYNIAQVNDIITKEDCKSMDLMLPTKEVVCVVDFTAFNDRKERRARAAQLKKDMDKKVKSLQEIAVFELLAEKSPELKAMLDQYRTLVDE